jgi:secreted trypsin-like serine protease
MNSPTLTALLLAGTCFAGASAHAQVDPGRDADDGSEPYREAVRRWERLRDPKIMGGRIAPDGAFPWQVSLGVARIADTYYSHFCGGSIYSDRWLITAAHCVHRTKPAQVRVVAGTQTLAPGVTRRAVARIVIHPDWNPRTYSNDIALVELTTPLELGPTIRRVGLVSESSENDVLSRDGQLTVVGWGARQEGGRKVRDLRYVEVPHVASVLCNKPYAYNKRITETMLCAGNRLGGKDACQGDSGGPLTANIDAAPVLVGVVSWGYGCGQPNKVGVYARVAKLHRWVEACVSEAPECLQRVAVAAGSDESIHP